MAGTEGEWRDGYCAEQLLDLAMSGVEWVGDGVEVFLFHFEKKRIWRVNCQHRTKSMKWFSFSIFFLLSRRFIPTLTLHFLLNHPRDS